MAHFAELDNNNIVVRVIVVADQELLDDSQNESEALGVAFCKSLFGEDTIWKQTSFNSTIRKNFAGSGCTYDEDKDAFIPIKPFPSWVLNDACQWESPVAQPTDSEKMYLWDEDNTKWILAESVDV